MKCLLIAADEPLADLIRTGLRQEGHDICQAQDGLAGLKLAAEKVYDILIIDRLLPGLDGLSLVRKLRGQGIATPVLFLTTDTGTTERIDGFAAGSDDCLVKPFDMAELIARLNGLARRPGLRAETRRLRVGNLEMDLNERRVTRAGKVINLQPREFKLLVHLMLNPGRIVTRSTLLESVWDMQFDPHTNIVETHISRLRAKIDKPFKSAMIVTIRGAGYCLDWPSEPRH